MTDREFINYWKSTDFSEKYGNVPVKEKAELFQFLIDDLDRYLLT